MKYLTLLFAVVLFTGCASEPSVQEGPDAEITFDGLHRVDNSRMKLVWIKPDLDLSGYNKLYLVGADFEYRAVKGVSGTSRMSSSRSEFPMDERQKAKLEEVAAEVFDAELAKSKHYEIVTEPGVDVLELKGALLDVVSSVPPDAVGRSDLYLSKIGEATLVLELRDSQSNEILVRAIDRRAIEPAFVTRSSRAVNVSEVRRELKSWAMLLTQRLDEIHEFVESDT